MMDTTAKTFIEAIDAIDDAAEAVVESIRAAITALHTRENAEDARDARDADREARFALDAAIEALATRRRCLDGPGGLPAEWEKAAVFLWYEWVDGKRWAVYRVEDKPRND